MREFPRIRLTPFSKKIGGLMFPDTATMYLAAIEDQDYKDEKINCATIPGVTQ